MSTVILGHILFGLGCLGAGILFGWIFTERRINKRINKTYNPVGTLRIDSSDSEGQPLMFLEIYKGVGDISSKTVVALDVSTEGYLEDSRN